ncbi:MAG: DNA mismatch repair endonuclease MutL [Lachnospiraceae bacterium]|nr:DNA mismatch repair endonuclease MutL [Lachnospiraceae bacterium]
MPNIQILDQSTINKIAAGEVIERPASVVKELLENAIDAKASAVTVEIRDGGISFIRVTDNGCGIPAQEIATAFLRHSTSKIRSVEDLFMVSSLGFRGEALSSIAAVAQVEVITRVSDSLTGTRYQIEGGQEKGLEEIGAPEGTTFIARNLFYNTPVRRKFLKTAMTEGAHVADLVEKIALSHPGISIRFIQNSQNKLYTSGNHNLKDIIYTVYGREITANLIPVELGHEAVSITGFAGKPVIARNNRTFENYFINGRYIKSSIICKAIEEAYRPFMMQHKYPFTMLHISIEPEYLDVNVHPTKMELRFQNGEMIFGLVRDAIAGALGKRELIPQVSLEGKQEKRTEAEGETKKPGREKRLPLPEPFEKRKPFVFREAETAYGAGAALGAETAYGAGAVPEAETGSRVAGPSGSGPKVPAVPAAGTGLDVSGGLVASGGSVLSGDPVSSGSPVMSGSPVSSGSPVMSGSPVSSGSPAMSGSPVSSGTPAMSGSPDTPASPVPVPGPARESAAPARQLDLFEEKLLEPKSRSRHKLIGQLFDTYWLVEFQNQLYIIDQHAAHEKVLYERTMESLKTREFTSQMVNPPVILTLGSREEDLLKRNLKYFHDVGFEIEPFGGREYAVRGVPDNLFSIARKELLMDMLDSLAEDTLTGSPELVYEKVASMSCKAAVKGSHAMSAAEADRLVDQLLDLENPYACPHGRPTIISMSKYELEKKFKRIV